MLVARGASVKVEFFAPLPLRLRVGCQGAACPPLLLRQRQARWRAETLRRSERVESTGGQIAIPLVYPSCPYRASSPVSWYWMAKRPFFAKKSGKSGMDGNRGFSL